VPMAANKEPVIRVRLWKTLKLLDARQIEFLTLAFQPVRRAVRRYL
jgi:hypothetical protein